jgi:hypothetical protein
MLRFVRFEETLAETVWPYGRLVSLRRPSDDLPEVGALRVEPAADSWQKTISQFVASASRVVMVVGFTEGLRWELAQVGETGLEKLILAFLPEHPDDAVGTWRQFVPAFAPLAQCSEETVRQALTLRFQPDQSPVFFTAATRSLEAYRLALLSCLVPLDVLRPFFQQQLTVSADSIG